MPRAGIRALAGWDEDPLTMAVEAARDLAGPTLSSVRFASTSAYFTDRSQAALIVDALALPRTVRTSDMANARRAGTSALLDCLLGSDESVVVAAEKRPTRPGSAAQLAYGDGAAAVRVSGDGAARLIGHASITHDFVDRYTSRDHPTPYVYEERFVRDVAVSKLIVPAVRDACAAAGLTPEAIDHVACAEPVGGCWKAAARVLKCDAPDHCARLVSSAGDLGAAHPLYGLGLALGAAQPGERVLVIGFGSGVDALIFEVREAVPGAEALVSALGEGRLLSSYSRFLSLSGNLELDWGMRSEFAQKAQATVLERVGRNMIGFVGGRDSAGSVQFPKSAIPVNPGLSAPEGMEDVRLANEGARVVSITADRLNFTPDPPFDFGLAQFDNGARVLMEFTDRPEGGFAVGDRVCMRLRIKSENKSLGMRTYFWKAAPVARPLLETA